MLLPFIVSANITSTLSYGTSGQDVSELQSILIESGCLNHVATGYFGSLTMNALKCWQKQNSIANTGSVDAPTITTLNKVMASAPASSATTQISTDITTSATVCPSGYTCTPTTPSSATVTCPAGFTCTTNPSAPAIDDCPAGYDCMSTNQSTINSTITLPPATPAQTTALMALCTASGQDCNTVLNGYNTNAIFRSNMDIMLQQWQAKQHQLASTPCTPAEKTKVLDAFLSTHTEYIPANDPNNVRWNQFRNIYNSYNPINICPQQLTDLLVKVDAELKTGYSPSQTTTSQQQTSTQGVTGNSANPLNFLYNMAPNSAVAGDQNSASNIFNPGVSSIQTQQQQYQQIQQQQQANAQEQQKLQDQLDQIKWQQWQQKWQQDQQQQQQQFQQQLYNMLPSCSAYNSFNPAPIGTNGKSMCR